MNIKTWFLGTSLMSIILYAYTANACTEVTEQPFHNNVTYATTYTALPYPQALSAQGKIDFAQCNKDAYQLCVHNSVPSYNPQSSSLAYTTNAGSSHISGSTDPLTLASLIVDSPKIITACAQAIVSGFDYIFDTTGKYKRQKTTRYIEEHLYKIDMHRHLLYNNATPHNEAVRNDLLYLENCIQELRIALYTYTTPKGCRDAYCKLEEILRNAHKTLLQAYPRTQEAELSANLRIAQYALELICSTKCSDKKFKNHAIDDYKRYVSIAEANLRVFKEEQAALYQIELRIKEAQRTFNAHYDELYFYCQTQQEYNAYNAIPRIEALQNTDQEPVTSKKYVVSETVSTYLRTHNHDIALVEQLTGNSYQHSIQQELVFVIEEISSLEIIAYQEALFDCSISACAYNQIGESLKATQIADFCWAFLDYGNAMAEGIGLGLCAAMLHIATHPIETTLYTIAGPYMAAYQLSTLLYSVLDIGITNLYDTETARDKWDTFIQPITDLYDALTDKERTTRDTIKTSAALITNLYAQTTLIGGLKKVCSNIVEEVTTWARTYPQAQPKDLISTPEGTLFLRSSTGPTPSSQSPVPSIQPIDTESEIFKQALAYGIDKSKLNHFFTKKTHNFDGLLELFGQNQELLVQKVLEALYKTNSTPSNGIFENILIKVEGYTVCTRGFVNNNVIKLGTMFIP